MARYFSNDITLDLIDLSILGVAESRRIFGDDYWAYGLEANRPSWDALCRYVYEQGLAPRRITPDDLFVPVE